MPLLLLICHGENEYVKTGKLAELRKDQIVQIER